MYFCFSLFSAWFSASCWRCSDKLTNLSLTTSSFSKSSSQKPSSNLSNSWCKYSSKVLVLIESVPCITLKKAFVLAMASSCLSPNQIKKKYRNRSRHRNIANQKWTKFIHAFSYCAGLQFSVNYYAFNLLALDGILTNNKINFIIVLALLFLS